MGDRQSHALCTPQGQESPEVYPLPHPRSGLRTFPKKSMVTIQSLHGPGAGPGQAACHLKRAVCVQGILDERGEYLPTLPLGRWELSYGKCSLWEPWLGAITWQSTLPQELL